MDEDGYFGTDVAAAYDDSSGEASPGGAFDPAVIDATAALLADLAGPSGRALEFAIGTGRVALPLAGRGVEVHGIDLSRAMIAQMRAKPGGADLEATVGDFTTTRVDGVFDLVYLVFNTIMNVTTQAAQVECFRNAAAHLRPGGRFLIEVMVPELRKLPPGQTMVPFRDGDGDWAFDRYDVVTQQMSSNYVTVTGDRGTFRSIPFRYAWPAEFDLMAQLAGMSPESRWADWARAPFTSESPSHVSIWIKH
jgi:SAM-dependent methyltransferase